MLTPPPLLDPVPVLQALERNSCVIVSAPPGSGKSTLLSAKIAEQFGRTLVSEPRRVAATSLARYIAHLRGEPLGDWVGYRIRFDDQSLPKTRLLYVTTGVLLNLLANNGRNSSDAIGYYDVVILDEFHERSLEMDVSLALVRNIQRRLYPHLKLVVMSATLNVPRLQAFLNAEVVDYGTVNIRENASGEIVFNGRYDVEVHYVDNGELISALQIIEDYEARNGLEPGSVLIFQPGKSEIEATLNAVGSYWRDAWLLPLHSQLPDEEQNRIFELAPDGRRKVVVATNIAEASITVPDVRYVIDSGMEKVMHYDERTRSYRLVLESISSSSATQRAGRAGRTQNGLAIRLWSKEQHQHLAPSRPPEIMRSDITRVVLLIKDMGITDIKHIEFLDGPSESQIEQAERTLQLIGALDDDGTITALGHQMARLPLEPRLARAILYAAHAGDPSALLRAVAIESAGELLAHIPSSSPSYPDYLWARRRLYALYAHLGSDLLMGAALLEQYKHNPGIVAEFFLRKKVLEEALAIEKQLQDILGEHGIDVADTPDERSYEIARAALAYSHVDLVMIQRGPFYRFVFDDHTQPDYRLDRFSLLSNAYVSKLDFLVGHRMRHVNGRFPLYLVSKASSISYELFSEVLVPHFTAESYFVDMEGYLNMNASVSYLSTPLPPLRVPASLLPKALVEAAAGRYVSSDPLLSKLAQAWTSAQVSGERLHAHLKSVVDDLNRGRSAFINVFHVVQEAIRFLESQKHQHKLRFTPMNDEAQSLQNNHYLLL